MDQKQYELICRCIRLGANVMSDELITSLNYVLQVYNEHIAKLEPERNTETPKGD